MVIGQRLFVLCLDHLERMDEFHCLSPFPSFYLFPDSFISEPHQQESNQRAIVHPHCQKHRFMEIQSAIVWCWAFSPHEGSITGGAPIRQGLDIHGSTTRSHGLFCLVCSDKLRDVCVLLLTAVQGHRQCRLARACTFRHQIRPTGGSAMTIDTVYLTRRACCRANRRRTKRDIMHTNLGTRVRVIGRKATLCSVWIDTVHCF